MIITSTMPCPKHGKKHSFEADLTMEQFLGAMGNWKHDGVFIQDAFPTLTPDQRELLITGTCQEAWDEMFPEEDDE